jgi:hypothetical protein
MVPKTKSYIYTVLDVAANERLTDKMEAIALQNTEATNEGYEEG